MVRTVGKRRSEPGGAALGQAGDVVGPGAQEGTGTGTARAPSATESRAMRAVTTETTARTLR